MKKHPWIMYVVGAILLGALAWLVHTRVHFQWSVFRDQLQHVDWRRIVLGVALVVFCYWLRAARWAVLLKPQKKVGSVALLGSQVIGFTAVALFGRLADLVRPYLVARRTKSAAQFANSRLHGGAHVRSGRDGAHLLQRLAARTRPRHAAPSRGPAAHGIGRFGSHLCPGHFRHQRARFGQGHRRLCGKDPRLALAGARSFGRNQDSRLSRRPRFDCDPG